MRIITTIVLFILSTGSAVQAADDIWRDQKAAFFGVTFIDTSTEGAINGIRPDETDRVAMIEEFIAEGFRQEGVVLVDLAPVRDQLERVTNPQHCNGCDTKMARELGARYSIVAEVQKVSNLILAINIYVRDAETGRQLRGQAVDIRGNTDDSWQRGARYILRNNIFRE